MAAVALQDHASTPACTMGDFPFDFSDYMLFDNQQGLEHHPLVPAASAGNFSTTVSATSGGGASGSSSSNNNNNNNSSSSRSGEVAQEGRVEGARAGGLRIAFRTQSEVEIMDDGFKWRKYGKKSVKNSPNPRNYYRCSTDGCSVKKRVERDREDPSYVITSYEGIHNHTSPGVVYYTTQDNASGRFLVAGCHPIPPSSS